MYILYEEFINQLNVIIIMKRPVIGYICDSVGLESEDKLFVKIADKMGMDIVFFNASEDIDEKELARKADLCDIIYNDTSMYIAIEMTKTLEELGKKVIDPSKVYYYTEDKWLFYLKCRNNNIPTPDTVLLSDNLDAVRSELDKFGHWPVILKRVYGERGEFVERADGIDEAIMKIKGLWAKGNERLPIIAQEFIKSDSYRVTVIGDEIVQTAVKKCHGWKATGCYARRFRKFVVDDGLKKIVAKLLKASGISICGIDLLKKEGEWSVLEINAEPSFKFFNCETEKLIKDVLVFLKKQI